MLASRVLLGPKSDVWLFPRGRALPCCIWRSRFACVWKHCRYKNWPASIEMKQIEIMQNKMGLKEHRWSSLKAPGIENPLPHSFLELGDFILSQLALWGSDDFRTSGYYRGSGFCAFREPHLALYSVFWDLLVCSITFINGNLLDSYAQKNGPTKQRFCENRTLTCGWAATGNREMRRSGYPFNEMCFWRMSPWPVLGNRLRVR